MRRVCVVLALLAGLFACPSPAGAVDGEWLRAKLAREMRLAGPGAGAYVVDLTGVRGGVAGDGTVFDQFPGSYRTGGRLDIDMGGELAGLAIDRGLVRGRFQRAPALTGARALASALRRRDVRVAGRTGVEAAPA